MIHSLSTLVGSQTLQSGGAPITVHHFHRLHLNTLPPFMYCTYRAWP